VAGSCEEILFLADLIQFRTILKFTGDEDMIKPKSTHDQLKRAQALNIAIVESTSDMIWSVDSENFGLLSFNHGMSDYFLSAGVKLQIGMRPENILENTAFIHQWHALYRRALTEGAYSIEYAGIDGKAQMLLTFGLLKQGPAIFGISVFCKDIRELKLAEIKSQLLSERLILATRVAKLGIWDWDIVKNELVWDDGMYHLYNIVREDFAGAYEAWSSHIHPEDKAPTEKAIQAALSGEREFAPEFRIIWSDGSVHYLQASATTFRDSTGNPLRMVGINFDITQLHNAESSIRDNEIRFRAFIEQSPMAIGVFSLDGLGLYANRKYLETLGLNSLEEFIGRPAYTYFAPQFIEESKERTRRRLQGLPVPAEYESVAVHPDGTEFPVRLAVAPIQLPSGTVSIAFLTDITERKQTETALKIEAQRYHALIESMNDWVWVAGPIDHEVTIFNSAIADYFKDNHNVIVKAGMIPEEMLSESRIEQWKGFYSKAISEGKLVLDYTTKAKKMHLKLSLSRLDVDGRTVGISVLGKDVTKETQYKEKLEESNRSLSVMLQQSINTISKIGELRDLYTAGHQKKVAKLSCEIAREMGLSDEVINNISWGALVHDIGKINIASDILNKPGKITNLEYQVLQTHAEQSYEVLKDIDFPERIKTMVFQHHERLDGSGYPQKLVGDQIILESRILAVADVVEAMTSHRPYRPALGLDVALEEIVKFKDTKYDGVVVDACVKLFQEKGFVF